MGGPFSYSPGQAASKSQVTPLRRCRARAVVAKLALRCLALPVLTSRSSISVLQPAIKWQQCSTQRLSLFPLASCATAQPPMYYVLYLHPTSAIYMAHGIIHHRIPASPNS
jgi:hypothetical protein